jgi:fibronectin type 3 domain-containing protein
VYVVRSAIANGAALESADSRPAIVTPKDIFPPAAPQGLVAAVLPSAAEAVVDLSWSINSEPDVAGYRVYRSESEGVRGEPLSADLSPSPAYRDATAQSGHRYWYSVTAIDRAGNESVPSAQILVEIAQPSS